ncbi:PEP-CTERM sorting domain-containing protein [Nitrosomonas supralitoralis]|uniref:PEP-CTERM sorting domain-containing protein n=1 Tax=Nitrosomonas supralitoralis TaxID=2116706 RepID=UPI0011C44CE7|nr:PEP-CTERM sorting domain-containing protein [Nitrosomonas supralitoralis]
MIPRSSLNRFFFNPFAGGGDAFTDLIEIVNNISLVAEPGIYTMLLVDLGLIGFMARRRKDTVE